jgi:WD40 repeat protein
VCTGLIFHPGGSSLVSSWASNQIRVSATTQDGETRVFAVEDPVALGFVRDGTALWAAAGMTVRNWSVPGWKENPGWSNYLATVFTGRLGINCLTAGRDWVLAGGRDGTLKVFSASDGSRPRGVWPCSSEPLTGVALSPDQRVAAVGAQDGAVTLFRLPSGERFPRRGVHRGSVEALAFAPDGGLLATGSRDRTIRLWSVAEGSVHELLTLRSPTGPVRSVAFSTDGDRLFTLGRGETAVRVWHLDRLRERLRPLGLDWE